MVFNSDESCAGFLQTSLKSFTVRVSGLFKTTELAVAKYADAVIAQTEQQVLFSHN